MEEITSLWNYHEIMDELKHRLLYTNLELEQLKMEANQEKRKNKEYMQQLIHLLEITCKERDEARNHLQNLLISPSLIPIDHANSCVTQPNTHSEINLRNMNVVDNNNNRMGYTKGTVEIENLVKGKALPEKGKFLQAVLEAGPILQTLIVAGPLPRWRNPPPLVNPFHIPPVSIDGREPEIVGQGCSAASRSQSPQLCFEISCSTAQILSNSDIFHSGHLGKRQRFQ